jgi:transcriptional regulator with XRE-family HTH domain
MTSYETPQQLSERTRISQRTLEKWRQDGSGPPFIKLDRKVLYDTAAADAWLAARTVASTSETTVRDTAEAAQ